MRLTTAEGGGYATALRGGNMGVGAVPSRGGLRPLPPSTRRASLTPPPDAGEGSRPAGIGQREVATENRLAAIQAFDPRDPLWVLAEHAAASIEGGRAAVLPPERRAKLLAMGTRLGLRPFDSHLVIAIVQDSARTGERVGVGAKRRLGLLRRNGASSDVGRGSGLEILLKLAMAGLIAVGLVSVFVGWLEA